MAEALDVFCEIPCLTEQTTPIKGIILLKKWFPHADKRYITQHLQKFIDYNSRSFLFLGVTPFLIGSDQGSSLAFRTSQFIGSAPLRSPDTGKQIGDFVVIPRFTGKDRYEEYIEILNLLASDIVPEVGDSLPLVSGRNFRPPLYLEATKFVLTLEELVKTPWQKFDRIEKLINEPKGQINWSKYTRNEFKVENKLRFPIGKNILSVFHPEYSQIKYVLNLCKIELSSPATPLRIKAKVKNKLTYIEEKLHDHLPLYTEIIQTHFSDSPVVRKCKLQANRILELKFQDSTAWRVDFSEVFERFVQYIFKDVAKEVGGRFLSNYRLDGYPHGQFAWGLKYLEPDGIFQKDSLIVFIDAKYKSNLYNKIGQSVILKEEHRRDIHQLLAYVSFNKSDTKFGLLCYPSRKVEINEIRYSNSINRTTSRVLIFGLPLNANCTGTAKKLLTNKLGNLETWSAS